MGIADDGGVVALVDDETVYPELGGRALDELHPEIDTYQTRGRYVPTPLATGERISRTGERLPALDPRTFEELAPGDLPPGPAVDHLVETAQGDASGMRGQPGAGLPDRAPPRPDRRADPLSEARSLLADQEPRRSAQRIEDMRGLVKELGEIVERARREPGAIENWARARLNPDNAGIVGAILRDLGYSDVVERLGRQSGGQIGARAAPAVHAVRTYQGLEGAPADTGADPIDPEDVQRAAAAAFESGEVDPAGFSDEELLEARDRALRAMESEQ